MKIKIKNIHFTNFLSFEEASFNFDTPGYILVQGNNKNPTDMAKSNGSGKSSLFEAISYALTGETIRGSNDVSRINGDNGALVELEFEIDNNSYIIRRTKDCKPYGTSLKFFRDGEDKSGKGIRDTEKIISEYLPELNSELLGSVIILGQGLPQRFSNNTPSGRKNILEKLSKADFMIEDLKDRISKRESVLSETINNLDKDLVELTTSKNIYNKNLNNLNSQLSELNSVSISELESQIQCLENDKISKKSLISNLEIELTDLEQKKQEKTSNKDLLQESKSKEINEENLKYSEVLIKLNESKAILSAQESTLKSEIFKAKNIKDICPTCGQKLVGVVKPDTSELESKLEDVSSNLARIVADINKLDYDKRSSINSISLKYENDFNSLSNELSILNTNILKITSNLKQLNSELQDLDNNILKLSMHKENYISSKIKLEDNISKTKKDIEDIESKILYINNDKDNYENHLSVIQKMKSIINRDFRGYLLSSIINFIDSKVKVYSKEVFNNTKLDFKLDGNNISITYDGKDYDNLSGGERQKIDLIIQFALRDMLCNYLNFSSNILVVDELFDNLDSLGCEKILNLISSKLTDVESIYIITHHADIPIPSDLIINIEKGENGVSRILNAI